MIVGRKRKGETEAEAIITHLDAGDEIKGDNDAFAWAEIAETEVDEAVGMFAGKGGERSGGDGVFISAYGFGGGFEFTVDGEGVGVDAKFDERGVARQSEGVDGFDGTGFGVAKGVADGEFCAEGQEASGEE